MWAVVGLGNPGRQYSQTRHNVGFSLLKRVAKQWKTRLRKRAYLSKAVMVNRKQEKVLLAMPQTYMNKSGLAIERIVNDCGVKPEKLVVVYDDLDIPLGEIRIRKEGGAGSHKGMISIIQEIRATQFSRIRIGIGPLTSGVEASDYVLSPFRKEEKPILEESFTAAQEALEYILDGEIEKAMNLYNIRGKTDLN